MFVPTFFNKLAKMKADTSVADESVCILTSECGVETEGQ